ncbi:MAG: spore germination protein [Eubacterium sp.]|jgi:spore germination protein KA|nr:spore germination protein [Eubacterium sp.]
MEIENQKLSADLQTTAQNLKTIMGYSSDISVKYGKAGGHNIAVFTCENMVSADTVANMIYRPLNGIGNKIKLELADLSEMIQNELLLAVQQLPVSTYGELAKTVMSGFAVLMIDGLSYAFAIGAHGFKYRAVSEPKTHLNIRSSREGFTEVIRINTTLLRRRIKSPKLVLKMMTLGDRSNTDVCLCYISDKADKKLVDIITKKLESIKISDILESAYLQPFLEQKGNFLFSEIGTTERPDTLAAKLYEGRIGIIVDGTPFSLYLPHLFIENFHTMDDYTGNIIFMGFIRLLKYLAFILTTILPGYYVAVANFHPEFFPSSLLFNLSQSIGSTPFPLLVECILIHIVYEVLREAGIRLPIYVGHTVSIVGGLVIGEIVVSAGIISAPVALIAAMGAVSSFIVADLYDSIIILRFCFILAGGMWGMYGVILLILVLLFKACSMSNYGVPFTAPITPFTAKSMRDTFFRLGWRYFSESNVKVQDLKGVSIEEMPGKQK